MASPSYIRRTLHSLILCNVHDANHLHGYCYLDIRMQVSNFLFYILFIFEQDKQNMTLILLLISSLQTKTLRRLIRCFYFITDDNQTIAEPEIIPPEEEEEELSPEEVQMVG